MIPKERRRILNVYKNIRVRDIEREHNVSQGIINSLTLNSKSDDPTDFVLHLRLNEENRRIRNQLPNRIKRIPVTYEVNKHYGKNSNCKDDDTGYRRCKEYDPVVGGVQVGPDPDGWGTLCYVDAESGTTKYLVTAAHVMRNDNEDMNEDSGEIMAKKMYHPAHYCSNSNLVADGNKNMYYNESEDIVAMQYVSNNYNASEYDTVGALPDIEGLWAWNGVVNETFGGEIDAWVSGAEDRKNFNQANDTDKGSLSSDYKVEHQVNYDSMDSEKGNSGAPYVDPDGFLVSMYNGCNWNGIGDHWDMGTCAEQVMELVPY